jgi:hydrogenase expression/formation protein HypC
MCLGVPRQVVGSVEHPARALVEVDGSPHEVSIDMLGGEDPAVGEWVVVHMGFAMERIDEQEAHAVLADMQQLDDWYAEQLGDSGEPGP